MKNTQEGKDRGDNVEEPILIETLLLAWKKRIAQRAGKTLAVKS